MAWWSVHVPSLRKSIVELCKTYRGVTRALVLSWQISPLYTTASMVLFPARGLLPFGQAWLLKLVVERAQAVLSGRGTGAVQGFACLILAEVALLIVGRVTGQLNLNVREILRTKVSLELEHRVLNKSAQSDLSLFETEAYYDSLVMARKNLTDTGLIVEYLLMQVQTLITFASMTAIVVRLNPWIALMVICLSVPQIFFQTKYNLYNWSMVMYQSPIKRRIDYYSNLLSDRGSAKEIRTFGIAGFLLDVRRLLQADIFRQNVAMLIKHSIWSVWFGAFNIVGIVGAWWYVLTHLKSGNLTIGDVSLYVTTIQSLSGSLESAWEIAGLLHQTAISGRAVFDFLDDRYGGTGEVQRGSVRGSEPLGATRAPSERSPAIGIRDVWFRYPQTDRDVLKGIDLEIKPGESVMLVGPNGSGKTTLVKLMLGLYAPTRGTVALNGRDLREYSQDELRRQLTAIFQDFVCYKMTVARNVAFGEVDKRGEVVEALTKAGAMEFVANLPQVIDTMLGKEFGGVDLSGGQWQRIALARAFFRKSPILILDEPTAALDPLAEEEIYRRIIELKEGRTVVLVSHRLWATKLVDRVVLLVDGSIRECGRHEELIALNGEYAKLYRLQASKYLPVPSQESAAGVS